MPRPAPGRPPDLDVDGIVDVLATGARRLLDAGGAVSQLDHALQTAALLAQRCPGDDELAAAGLVHDIGHLLEGSCDETHAVDGARAVRRALGERVAGIVALHVEAKRYLVGVEEDYGEVLGADSVASLRRQGGALSAGESAVFLALPGASDALTLRRADDAAKAEDLDVGDLARWVPVLREVAARTARAPTA